MTNKRSERGIESSVLLSACPKCGNSEWIHVQLNEQIFAIFDDKDGRRVKIETGIECKRAWKMCRCQNCNHAVPFKSVFR